MAELYTLYSPILWILLPILIVTIATFVQASSGLGFAMIAMPGLAVIDLQYVPGPALFLMLFLSIWMAHAGRKNISRAGLVPLVWGMVLGVPVGGICLGLVSADSAGLLFAVIILVALVLPKLGISFEKTTGSYVFFGMASGVIGTISGMHGPVLAVLFQGTRNLIARPTIAAIFVIGASLSLASLWWFGRFGQPELRMALSLSPGLIIGLALAQSPLNKISDETAAVMMTSVAMLSAVVIIAKEIVGYNL